MKNVKKKYQKLNNEKPDKEQDGQIYQQKYQQKQHDLEFPYQVIVKENKLFVTFHGIIEAGVISDCQSLTLTYLVTAGPDWIKVGGIKSGSSQVAASDGQKIVWNLPFQISYETTYLSGWPQIIVVLEGYDFFGRPFIQGYGNIHLPTTSGVQNRIIRIFKPLPQSIISGIFGYLGGLMASYKDYQKVLSLGQGRQVTRVCTQGEINLKIEATKHNFKRFGYE